MIFFPAIDIIDGKCVRLRQGDFSQKTSYHEDPVSLALNWQEQGATHLHLVDLDGARSGEIKNLSVLEKICSSTKLQVDFGGGIKNKSSIDSALNAGAAKVNLGSISVKNPALFTEFLQTYKYQIILSMDLKDGYIAVNGWQQSSSLSAAEMLNRNPELQYVSVTDISRDGMLQGPNFELYQALMEKFPTINFIASGGVSSLEDLAKLHKAGLFGCIAGKAILEGRFSIDEALRNI